MLSRDKGYVREAGLVLEQFRLRGGVSTSLPDLGRGTGRHIWEMAWYGLAMPGVDMSETMLDMGRAMSEARAPGGGGGISSPDLMFDDVRNVRLGEKIEKVPSFFHVMSYQTRAEDA